jgi:hypothetical protein
LVLVEHPEALSRQAFLVLAHRRNGDTYTRLATGFGIGVATVYRYIREALGLLATAASTLDQAVYRASRLLWDSPALPGATHGPDRRPTPRIPATLVKFGVACYADNAYRAAGPTIGVPFRRGPRALSANQKTVNRNHARNRAPGERAVATLKTWKLLTKLRCCPRRATAIIAAIRVLRTIEVQQR